MKLFDRYNIVDERDLQQAALSLSTYFRKQSVTLTVTLGELMGESSGTANRQEVESSEELVEPASRIEPQTCGLRIRGAAFFPLPDYSPSTQTSAKKHKEPSE